MLRKFSVIGLIIIGMLAFFCFATNLLFVAKAENFDNAQNGVAITKNYDISSSNDGKYASLLLNKNNDLSDYYKKYYSGGDIDFNSGYLYEADADGITSTVFLLEEYSGTFSIVGQGFYDAYATENNVFVADYGRLTFKFTNSLNNKQYYKFSFTQTASHYLELNFYYFDEDVQSTSIYRVTKKISMSFTEKSAYMNNKNLPFRFEYIMETQTLNMRDETVSAGATHNLNTLAGATLPVFENYSVQMSFENKSQQNTAKFIVYELCQQVLKGETLTDTAVPVVLSVKAEKKRLVAKAYDLVDGVINDNFTFTVKNPDGENVTHGDDSAKFDYKDNFGDYTVTVSVKDKSGKISDTRTFTITLEKDTVKPSITVDGQYKRTYLKGDSLTVLPFTATDENLINDKGYTIKKNGETVQAQDGVLNFDSVGKYEIIYYAVDEFENRQEVIAVISVCEISVPESIQIETAIEAQSIPQLSTPSGWYYYLNMYLKSDEQMETPIEIENGEYLFTSVEEYLVVYSVIPELETQAKYTYQTAICVVDTQKPTIELLDTYKEKYNLGDSLSIIGVQVLDNSLEPTLTIEVFCGTEKVTVGEDGVLVLNKIGTYEVKYLAKDTAGNQTELSVNFEVVGAIVPEPTTDVWLIVAIVAGAVLVVSGIVVLVIKKNRSKLSKEDNDE